MARQPLASRQALPDSRWYPLAGALLVGGPVWRAFYQSHYPLAAPEATLIPVVAGALGLLAGVLTRRLPEPYATLLFLGLVALFLDLQFDPEQNPVSLLVGGIVLVVPVLLRGRRGLLTVVCLAGLYLSTLPVGWSSTRPLSAALIKGRRPIILHVILDSQWGPAGLRAAGDSATADFLSDFYSTRGFRVYQGAYSRYSETRFALGSLMALGGKVPIEPAGLGSFKLMANPYFDTLAARGYHLRVFQSSHLNLCSAARIATTCLTASASSLGNVGYLRGRWQPRALLAARFFLTTRSHLYFKLHGRDGLAMRRSSAGRAVALLETVRRAIAAGEGDAYFVHVLLPHPPFEVDATCVGYANLDQRLANVSWKGDSLRKLEAYAGQTRCAHRLLAGLLATVDSTVGRDQAIVVVHGDHGSRLLRLPRRPAAYPPDVLNGYYSTLFAVRAPALPAGSVPGAISIQDLLRSFVATDFTRVEVGSGEPYVIVGTNEPGAEDTIRILRPSELLWVPQGESVGVTGEPPASSRVGKNPAIGTPR